MNLAEQIAADFAADGKLINYKGVPIYADVRYGSDQNQTSEGTVTEATIIVLIADVPSPAYRDVVTIDGNDWHVKKIERGAEYGWEINLIRDERTTFRR